MSRKQLQLIQQSSLLQQASLPRQWAKWTSRTGAAVRVLVSLGLAAAGLNLLTAGLSSLTPLLLLLLLVVLVLLVLLVLMMVQSCSAS
jgi:hypothetical protein